MEIKLWNLLLQDAAKAKTQLDARRVTSGLHQGWPLNLTAASARQVPPALAARRGTRREEGATKNDSHFPVLGISGNAGELLVPAQGTGFTVQSTGSPALLF